MRLNHENIEEINDLSSFVNWIETPPRMGQCSAASRFGCNRSSGNRSLQTCFGRLESPPAFGLPSLALLPDDPALDPDCWSSLFSPPEWAEGRQKSAPAAFRAWFLGRLAAKAAVGRQWGRRPDQVEILKGSRGRPELVGGGHVSISHTDGAAVAAAGPEPLGLDLERRDRLISERLQRWAFTGSELELAEAAPPFWPGPLALWCAREAGAKAWGRGLLNHLEQVRVGWADWAAGRLRVDWLGSEPASIWVDLINAGDYLLALAGDGRERV